MLAIKSNYPLRLVVHPLLLFNLHLQPFSDFGLCNSAKSAHHIAEQTHTQQRVLELQRACIK